MRYPAIILLGVLAGTTSIRAQDEVITTEFVTLAFNGSVPGYYYRNGKEVMKLGAARQGISAPTYYRGSRLLSLYANEADLAPRKPGEAVSKPVLQAHLPLNHDRILLIFSFTKNKKERIPRLQALGISTKEMKEGDYRVFNLSKQTVYAILNDKKATIQPGKPINLSSSSWRSDTLDMNVKFGLKDGGKLRSVYSSVWGHRPVRRMFLFIFDRPDKFRPLDIRMFYDVPKIKAARRAIDPGIDATKPPTG